MSKIISKIAETAVETAQLEDSWWDRLKNQSKSEERFDREYVTAIQSKTEEAAQKTVRQYQILVAIIKIAAKVAFVVNLQNFLTFLTNIGFQLPGGGI